jgi:hypothetical protein
MSDKTASGFRAGADVVTLEQGIALEDRFRRVPCRKRPASRQITVVAAGS